MVLFLSSSRRRHTRSKRVWSSDVCSSDLRAPGLVVSYVPQDAAGLAGDLTGFARAHGIDESLFKAILRKMDFSRVQFEKDMASRSEERRVGKEGRARRAHDDK